jgi:hypothetical protein
VRTADPAERVDQEPVAGEDRRRVAVDDARRGAAAPGVGEVDDVVVEQGRGVDQLDRDRELLGAGVEPGADLARERDAHRPEVLAPKIQEMVGRALHDPLAAGHRLERALDVVELVADPALDRGGNDHGEDLVSAMPRIRSKILERTKHRKTSG